MIVTKKTHSSIDEYLQFKLGPTSRAALALVYLPSSDDIFHEYCTYFDYLWILFDSLSTERMVMVMGDLNGKLSLSLRDKGTYEANQT